MKLANIDFICGPKITAQACTESPAEVSYLEGPSRHVSKINNKVNDELFQC